ncbi:MAG: ABC transporter ATP-binding protein [Terriglobia bacterium]
MICVEQLTKIYGGFTAIDSVSFEVKAGETFALLGPNGSGKSTTLKCLAGLVQPSRGRMMINGADVLEQSREARKSFSYLPQRVGFHDNLTAREVLHFYCKLRKVNPQQVDVLLSNPHFDFNGFSDRLVGEFSGGMLQRLGLAIACLPDTSVLMLDEPTVNLDPAGAVQFREFLAHLKQQGKTILFSSHVLADVEQLADKVGILVGGKLIALETISGLRAGLMRTCKMQVVLENPDSRWLETSLQAGAEEAHFDGDSLWITASPELRFTCLKSIESAGGRIARLMTEEMSLEDIYLDYIRKNSRV